MAMPERRQRESVESTTICAKFILTETNSPDRLICSSINIEKISLTQAEP